MGLFGGDSSVIGLNIGSSTIKAVELKGKGDRIELLAMGIIPTPEGSVANGVVMQPQELAQAIKDLLSQNGFRSRKVVSSVSGQASLVVRIIEVLRMTEKELAESMKWEVERQIPFNAAEVIMDYKAIHYPDEDPNAQNMEVLLAAAQEEMINAHVQMLEAAGLKPVAIDIESLAASRALVDLGKNGDEKQDALVIVNIGASNTEINVIRNGLLAFTRTVPVAGESLTTSLCELLGLQREDAERAKKEMGMLVTQEALPPAQETARTGEPGSADLLPESAVETGGPASAKASDSADPFGVSSGGVFGLDLGEPVEPVPVPEQAPPVHEEPAAPAPSSDPFDLSLDLAPPAQTEPAVPISPGEASPLEVDLSDIGVPDSATTFSLDEEPGVTGSAATVSESSPLDVSEQLYGRHEEKSEEEPAPEEDSGVITGKHISEALTQGLIELVTETRRSLEYYGSRYPDTTISRVMLIGGTANLRGLDAFLASELELPVQVSNPFEHLQGKVLADLSQEYLKEVAPVMAVSIGLASRDMVG